MTLPRLRQVVLLTGDLESAAAEARRIFGFERSVRDEEGMKALGFEHEVFTFRDSFLEIVAPLTEDSWQGELVAKYGDAGYMTDVQVSNLDAVVARGAESGMSPVLHQEYEGNWLSQWHPRDLGTLAEFDQITPEDTWHFAPGIFADRADRVATDIAGAAVAVDNPVEMARRWGELLGRPVDNANVVRLPSTAVRFVPREGHRRGLVEVDVWAGEDAEAGSSATLCGVTFNFMNEPVEGGTDER